MTPGRWSTRWPRWVRSASMVFHWSRHLLAGGRLLSCCERTASTRRLNPKARHPPPAIGPRHGPSTLDPCQAGCPPRCRSRRKQLTRASRATHGRHWRTGQLSRCCDRSAPTSTARSVAARPNRDSSGGTDQDLSRGREGGGFGAGWLRCAGGRYRFRHTCGLRWPACRL
jgi:hypothetical protein